MSAGRMYKDDKLELGPELDSICTKIVQKSHAFWIGTAPNSDNGHINISIKGLDGTCSILLPKNAKGKITGVTPVAIFDNKASWDDSIDIVPVNPRFNNNPLDAEAPVARLLYLDIGAYQIETSCHLLNNGRTTVMFTSFDAMPGHVRFYGYGRSVFADNEVDKLVFQALAKKFLPKDILTTFKADFDDKKQKVLSRAIIIIDVFRIRKGCGHGAPIMKFVKDRPNFVNSFKSDDGQASLFKERMLNPRDHFNRYSLDGIPSMMNHRNLSHSQKILALVEEKEEKGHADADSKRNALLGKKMECDLFKPYLMTKIFPYCWCILIGVFLRSIFEIYVI